MLANSLELVKDARGRGVAVGAFNTYNLETTRAIIQGAEKVGQPVILQVGVPALKAGGEPLAVALVAAARVARIQVSVHLDHCAEIGLIKKGFEWGFSSALADGSHLSFEENIAFTRQAVELAAKYGGLVEAELGRLMGTEDGISIEAPEASLTDPTRAYEFVQKTGAALLAVSIGNIHGYSPNPPPLDFNRLARVAAHVGIPLVLHGASGMQEKETRRAIELGVGKLNVNTEVRVAFLKAISEWGARVGLEPDTRKKGQDLMDLHQEAIAAAEKVVIEKIKAFSLLTTRAE